MQWVWQGAFLVLATILQNTLADYLGGFGVKPDFVLIIVVYIGLFFGAFRGEILGFSGGLLEDILSGGPLGINALTKSIIGFLSGIIKKNLYPERIISQAAILAGATLIDGCLVASVKLLIYTKPQSLNPWIILVEPFYNTLFGLLIFQLLVRARKE